MIFSFYQEVGIHSITEDPLLGNLRGSRIAAVVPGRHHHLLEVVLLHNHHHSWVRNRMHSFKQCANLSCRGFFLYAYITEVFDNFFKCNMMAWISDLSMHCMLGVLCICLLCFWFLWITISLCYTSFKTILEVHVYVRKILM